MIYLADDQFARVAFVETALWMWLRPLMRMLGKEKLWEFLPNFYNGRLCSFLPRMLTKRCGKGPSEDCDGQREMVKRLIKNWVRLMVHYRWLVSIVLLLLLDVSTYLAFAQVKMRGVVSNQDKLYHCFGFAVLFMVGHVSLQFDFCRNLRLRPWVILAMGWVFWIGYGIFIELGQKYLSQRTASLGDLIADMVGMGMGMAVVIAFKLFPERGLPHGEEREDSQR